MDRRIPAGATTGCRDRRRPTPLVRAPPAPGSDQTWARKRAEYRVYQRYNALIPVNPLASGAGATIKIRRVVMGSMDIPEYLILLGILAGIAWALYNRTHPHHGEPR